MGGPTPHPDYEALVAQLDARFERLATDVERLLRESQCRDPVPPKLFHFTDTKGLIGILRSKSLWASLASTLNDTSETRFAPERLRERLLDNRLKVRHLDAELLAAFLVAERFGSIQR